jgi:hypothetical protein
MYSIEQLEISGSHREVGRGIGLRFAGAIHRLFDNYGFLQKQLLPFLKTSAGQSFFQSCLKMHQTHFPQYNEFGILHSINNVAPRPIKVGLSRHFLARALLDARTLDDAVRVITMSDRASGFNYNIGSLSERRVVSVEVSPERHHVHEVQGYYTHTNHYLQLNHPKQEITLSSRKRLERSLTLCRSTPPIDGGQVLALLSDQTDRDFPKYRDATLPDNDATLCSALYDLDRRELRIYWGNPVREPEKCMQIAM